MCNQAVGLVAEELERRGIATVTIQLLEAVACKVRPPRGLLVPFPHGYPLGKPDDLPAQHSVLEAALDLLTRAGPPPVLEMFSPEGPTAINGPHQKEMTGIWK